MNNILRLFIVVAICILSGHSLVASPLLVDAKRLVYSSPQGRTSEPAAFTIFNHSPKLAASGTLRFVGTGQDAFGVVGVAKVVLTPGASQTVAIRFSPPEGRVGVLRAQCEMVDTDGQLLASVELVGLSAPGLEGKGEAPMIEIVEALGLGIDVGWSTLGNHTRPEMVGDEVSGQVFRKAGRGNVRVLPVARYSPDFLLPFGYYDAGESKPELHVMGTLALATDTRYEQNCLYPSLASGSIECDPEFSEFGFFTASPSHVAYTQDSLNRELEPDHVAHAVRVYPAKDMAGEVIMDTYLVCFEEAKNGDYQDYVFLVSNVALAR